MLTHNLVLVMELFMKTVRITGIVKLANDIRREICGPVAPQRLAQLQKNVKSSLQQIDRILTEAAAGPEALPAPSRKAYQFLSSIDFSSITTQESSAASDRPPGTISFPGLKSYLDGILDTLAQNDGQAQWQQVYNSICATSTDIERQILTADISPEHLKAQTRDIRGWLAYFSEKSHFEAYSTALNNAVPAFTKTLQDNKKLSSRILIHFRPMKGIFRLRRYSNATLVQFPTPMISFGRDNFEVLSGLALRQKGRKQFIMKAMLAEPYQEILSEIELLSGIIDHTAGVHYDLAKSFDRVNAAYFHDSMTCPRLVWSQTFTCRKFGHYDHTHDTVLVSISLDKNEVPEYVVDFIVYHELLHKKFGITFGKSRNVVHNRKFLLEEKRFHQYSEAKEVLKKIAEGKL